MVWHMTSKRSAPASSRQCPGGRAVGRPRGRGDHAAAMYAPYGKRPDPSLLYGLVYTVAAVGALLWLLVLRAVQSRGRSAPILAVVVTTVTGALALLCLAPELIAEATQEVEVGHDLDLRLRPGAWYPAGQGWRGLRGGRGRGRVQLAPDDLARGILGGIPVPAGAQAGNQEHAVARAGLARLPGAWRLRVRVPDLDENPGASAGAGAGQVHRYRLAGLAGGVDRVGDELGHEELGALDQGVQPPLPQDVLDVQAGT